MIKGVIHVYVGPILYHSELSDVPNSPNQFLSWEFFCRFLQQDGSKTLQQLKFLTYSKASRYTASSCTDLDNARFWIGSKKPWDARFLINCYLRCTFFWEARILINIFLRCTNFLKENYDFIKFLESRLTTKFNSKIQH